MARPRVDPDRESTPERILASALQVFARDGLAAARLADIARGASVTRPSLLYHFSSKLELYEAVVKRSFARVGALLGAAMLEPEAFPVRLRKVAEAYARELGEHPEDARIFVRELTSDEGPGRAILLDEVTTLVDRVVVFVEAGPGLRPGLDVRAAVVQVAADVLLASATSGAVREALWGQVSPERTAALTAMLFLAEESD